MTGGLQACLSTERLGILEGRDLHLKPCPRLGGVCGGLMWVPPREAGGGGGKSLAWVGGPESNSLPGFNEPQSPVRAAFHHLLFGQTGGSINL